MKVIIVFYSFSGNTRLVANLLKEKLTEKGYSVDLIELKPIDESEKFFNQALRAFFHKKAKLKETKYNLSEYQIICFGSPIWAFGPAPALNTYLEKVFGLENKKAIIFGTYGSGVGREKFLSYIKTILLKKGITDTTNFLIQQNEIKNRNFVFSEIEKAITSLKF